MTQVSPARLLLDEMFSPVFAAALRDPRHDVTAIAEKPALCALTDEEVFALASAAGTVHGTGATSRPRRQLMTFVTLGHWRTSPQAGDIAIWLCALPGYDSDKRSGVQACPRPPVLVARWGRAVATDHSRREEPWTSAPSA